MNFTEVANHMSTLDTAGSKGKKIKDVIDVVRHGDKLIIPEGLDLPRVDAVIHARMAYEQEEVKIYAPIDAPFVFEGAYALHTVLTDRFGWAQGIPTPGFFGSEPPTMLSVPVGPGKTVQVPWGRFSLPGLDGYLEAGTHEKPDGTTVFRIGGQVKRMHEPAVNEIVEAVKRQVREHSIYRGTAFRVRLFNDDGERLPMPEPTFIELDPSIREELVLPKRTRDSVETNIFTPILQTQRVTKFGIPLKRGILLAGPFGTGKTMIARATAEYAVSHGWTYVEVEKIVEITEVVKLARQYGDNQHGVVLFCEDIDRIMRGDDRSIGIDGVLNVIDGVESKGSALMIVLTTNELERITTALLRPGRLDAIIHVGPPDAEAAERLARQYGRGLIPLDEPLTGSREMLAGKIPAVIREIVERSKLAAIRLTPVDDDLRVTDEALRYAAEEMQEHIDLLTPVEEDKRSERVKAAQLLSESLSRFHDGAIARRSVATAHEVVLDGVDPGDKRADIAGFEDERTPLDTSEQTNRANEEWVGDLLDGRPSD
jgi:transitional endoplasmic reticulum ATPase